MKPSEQVPYQLDGEPCSLYKLVRKEPDWAVSRINYSVDRIAELEQELLEERASYEAERQRLQEALERCKMRTLSPDADRLVSEYTTKYKALEAELAHANIESVDLENECQRLREALPPPDRLKLLAGWFDCNNFSPNTEVQDDLRKWADAIEQALEKET